MRDGPGLAGQAAGPCKGRLRCRAGAAAFAAEASTCDLGRLENVECMRVDMYGCMDDLRTYVRLSREHAYSAYTCFSSPKAFLARFRRASRMQEMLDDCK